MRPNLTTLRHKEQLKSQKMVTKAFNTQYTTEVLESCASVFSRQHGTNINGGHSVVLSQTALNSHWQ